MVGHVKTGVCLLGIVCFDIVVVIILLVLYLLFAPLSGYVKQFVEDAL